MNGLELGEIELKSVRASVRFTIRKKELSQLTVK